MTQAIQISYLKLGQQRGIPRLWLQGLRLADAGYTPGAHIRIELNQADGTLSIVPDQSGDRIVSKKQAGQKEVPVIDVCNKALTSLFGAIERVRVTISNGLIRIAGHPVERARIEREDRLQTKLENGEALRVGSVCHGGGVLDKALHDGMAAEQVATRLGFAIDTEPEYLQASLMNNPVWGKDSITVEGRLEEAEPELLGRIDLLVGGLPCTGASRAGKSKNGIKHAEEHESAGTAFMGYLDLVKRCNPAICLIENVREYRGELSYLLIQRTLAELGYVVHDCDLSGAEFGALEDRNRMCMVAVSRGIPFTLAPVAVRQREASLAEILEHVPENAPNWRALTYLDDKQVRDKAAGKGFALQIVKPEATRVGTIGRHYAKYRSCEPMLAHPNIPGMRRLLTPIEHARVKTIDPALVEGVAATTAHQILGQSVIAACFEAVGRCIARALKLWRTNPAVVLDAVAQCANNDGNANIQMPLFGEAQAA